MRQSPFSFFTRKAVSIWASMTASPPAGPDHKTGTSDDLVIENGDLKAETEQ